MGCCIPGVGGTYQKIRWNLNMIHDLIDRMAVLDMMGVEDRVCFTDMSYHGQKGFVGEFIGGVELFGWQVVRLAILHKLLDDPLVEPIVISGHVHDKILVTDDTQLLQQGKQTRRRNGSMKIVCFHFLF
jgi:hypothetical protein